MTKLQVKERPKPSCDVWTSNSQIVCESAQTRFHIKSPPCLFIKKSVLKLARPSFLTGAIIQTRIQASLLAPPGFVQIEIHAKDKIETNFAIFAAKVRLSDMINLEDDIKKRSLWSLFFFMVKIEGKRSRRKLARNC